MTATPQLERDLADVRGRSADRGRIDAGRDQYAHHEQTKAITLPKSSVR
jgi:hypothetical protein